MMIYFDNAATSKYKPRAVRKAAARALKDSANPGRGSHRDAMRCAMIVHETRQELAEFLHGKGATVIFTKNCTEALNLAILGTAKLGGHVVTTSLEHNSVLRPLSMLRKEGLISLTVVKIEDGTPVVESIKSAITEKTYLVAITSMSNVTGYTPPLAQIGELCASNGIKFLVDGAQGIGHTAIDFDGMQMDMLCGAGHKSLHGAQGTGFLIYGKGTFITPLLYGGTGTESDNLLQPILPPESLESGTLNLTGIAALGEGVRWTMKNQRKINAKISDISEYLHDKAAAFPEIKIHSVKGSPFLTFSLPKERTERAADLLNERYNIAVRYGLHCAPLALGKGADTPTVRISIGANNTLRQAKRLIRAMQEILRKDFRQK